MIADRIFQCEPGQDIRLLIPDNDVLPLDFLNNVFEIYRDQKKVIILARLGDSELDAIKDITELDPLTVEAVKALGIEGSYIGETLDDLFLKYPVLKGNEITIVDWETISTPIVSIKTWA